MRTKLLVTIVVFVSSFAIDVVVAQPYETPVDYVNILMGTQSEFALSNGNTYPAVARPWGMNFWTPQTRRIGD